MKFRSIGTIWSLGVMLSGSALGQQIPISGTVTASDGVPLRGVAVRVLATDSRTVTDVEGRYSLIGVPGGVLSFSVPGRRPIQKQILGRNTVDVSMELDRLGWWAAIPSGQAIRIVAADQRYDGSFVRLSDERIELQTMGASESIAIRQIDSLWSYREATSRGIWVGALAGAVALSGFALFVDRRCADCTRSVSMSLVIASASAGALVGAFVGAALGAKYRMWKRAYP